MNAVIYGGAAIGSREFTQLTSLGHSHIREDLFDRLAGVGVDEPARKELDAAMVEHEVAGRPRLGQKVGAWLAKHANSAVDAGAQEAESTRPAWREPSSANSSEASCPENGQ